MPIYNNGLTATQKELMKPALQMVLFNVGPESHMDGNDPYRYVPQAKMGATTIYIASGGTWITEDKSDATYASTAKGAEQLISAFKDSLY